MKRYMLIVGLLPLLVTIALVVAKAVETGAPPGQEQASATQNGTEALERAAIAQNAQAFIEAYKKGDANTLANFWTPDGDYMDLDGRVIKGRKAIADDFAQLFAENKGMKLRIELASVRFPTPDTAVEDGVTSVISPDGPLPSRARYTNVLIKKDGRWLISSVRESPYTPPSNYEHLRPLEWAIGEWVEDVKEGHVGRVAYDWSQDRNFIIGVRAVGIKDVLLDNGSQRIGWDPAAKLIRSWNFESDGGFGEGEWKNEGDNKWIIKMSSVLSSGSLMTSTSVVTRIDANTITWQSKEQVVDGKALPDTSVITMKRAK